MRHRSPRSRSRDEATLRAAAQRAYARGRRAWRTAEGEPTVEHLHAWRKRVKDLWYHQRLLATAWPQALEPQAKQSHRLSDLLGELRAQAQDLAARVYAEKPKAYGRRLGAYMHAAHDMSTPSLGT